MARPNDRKRLAGIYRKLAVVFGDQKDRIFVYGSFLFWVGGYIVLLMFLGGVFTDWEPPFESSAARILMMLLWGMSGVAYYLAFGRKS